MRCADIGMENRGEDSRVERAEGSGGWEGYMAIFEKTLSPKPLEAAPLVISTQRE
jgi:hypothetical protein